jgi:hypothetical protein
MRGSQAIDWTDADAIAGEGEYRLLGQSINIAIRVER